jgi:hypothetical protein
MQILVAVVQNTKPATQPSSLIDMEKKQWKLFESCWDEPENRPSAAEVVNWLQGLGFKDLSPEVFMVTPVTGPTV